VNLSALRDAIVAEQHAAGEPFADPAGVSLTVAPGAAVEAGQPIARARGGAANFYDRVSEALVPSANPTGQRDRMRGLA